MSVLDGIKQQKSFYRNQYRGTLTALIVAFVIIIILCAVNVVLMNRKYDVYYASSTEGEVFLLHASEQPPPHAILSSS